MNCDIRHVLEKQLTDILKRSISNVATFEKVRENSTGKKYYKKIREKSTKTEYGKIIRGKKYEKNRETKITEKSTGKKSTGTRTGKK
jgi:hypothetical protein